MNRGHPVGCMYALPLLDHDARRTLAGNTIIRIVASCRQAVTSTMIKKYFAKSGQLILTGFTHQDLVECETALCSFKCTWAGPIIGGQALPASSSCQVQMSDHCSLYGRRRQPQEPAGRSGWSAIELSPKCSISDNQRTAAVNVKPQLAPFNAHHVAVIAQKPATKSEPKRRRKTARRMQCKRMFQRRLIKSECHMFWCPNSFHLPLPTC
jgi:hypothetical protein